MHIIDVVPEKVHFLIDIPMDEMEYIKIILDNMVFNFDSKLPEHMAAKAYLENKFYPTIDQSIKSIRNGNRPNS